MGRKKGNQMHIKPFGIEMWMNEFEDHCKYNLAETCVKSMTIGELIEVSGKNTKLSEELANIYEAEAGGSPDIIFLFIYTDGSYEIAANHATTISNQNNLEKILRRCIKIKQLKMLWLHMERLEQIH